jgi:hypothetical protein
VSDERLSSSALARACLPVCLRYFFEWSATSQPCFLLLCSASSLQKVAFTCIYMYTLRAAMQTSVAGTHSHPLQTRTITCATIIAASVPTHAVAQGRPQLSSFEHFLSLHCAYHHPPLLFQSVALKRLGCQLKHNVTCRIRVASVNRYADCVLGKRPELEKVFPHRSPSTW